MSIFSRALAAPIRVYQRIISANTQPRCRYAPTCSNYAIEALEVHGVFKGTLLSVWRLLRCNPWSAGGVDRVPPKGAWPTAPLGHSELLALYEQEDSSPHAHNKSKKTTKRT
ncbi:MAG: membrane protein insertion efficiency factor YidD [Actinomycetaceae bacterium]|nr:membrane protein insertion efficiency factor YidD [Actinomycetaceae bacterium]